MAERSMTHKKHRIEGLRVGEINRHIIDRLSDIALLKEGRLLALQAQKGTVQPYTGRYLWLRLQNIPALYRPPRKDNKECLDTLPPNDYVIGEVDEADPEQPLVEMTPKHAPYLTYVVHVDESLNDVPISEVLGGRVHYPSQAEAEAWSIRNDEIMLGNIARQ